MISLPAKERFPGSGRAGVMEEHPLGPQNASFARVAPVLFPDPYTDSQCGSEVAVWVVDSRVYTSGTCDSGCDCGCNLSPSALLQAGTAQAV